MKPAVATVDEYIDQFPPHKQKLLQQLRATIRAVVPDAAELISYGMPAYKRKRTTLVYIGATNHHIGFYPTSTGVAAFADELTGYDCAKGTIRFPFDKPLPGDLIAAIVRYRVEESEAEALKHK